jgi:hypothetical protein
LALKVRPHLHLLISATKESNHLDFGSEHLEPSFASVTAKSVGAIGHLSGIKSNQTLF